MDAPGSAWGGQGMDGKGERERERINGSSAGEV